MDVERVATAALLHDIGKFWSRTGEAPPFTEQERDHFGTYNHALWTGHFIERYLRDSELAAWARMHHAPDSRASWLISLADWLSSAERLEEPESDRGRPEEAGLVSILAGLRLAEAQEPAEEAWTLPLQEHGSFDDGFMPRQGLRTSQQHYANLWSGFEAQVRAVDITDAPHATWLALLRRYCSRIPSATPTRHRGYVPDVNLYDHSRTVAALAACFAASGLTEARASELRTVLATRDSAAPALRDPLCLLACGNLSGIQDFLYTLASKHAAKSLRGRSLALQLIADAAASFLCSQAGVPESCIVYNGGGRFYVLLPLTTDVGACARRIGRALQSRLQGRLSLNIGSIELSAGDFQGAAFASAWVRAGQASNAERARRYSALAAEDYDAVFGFLDEGGSGPRCAVCGCECPGDSEDDSDRRCAECAHFEEWGQALPHARWIARADPAPEGADGLGRLFADLGTDYRIARHERDLPPKDRLREIAELNDYNPGRTRQELRPAAHVALTYRLTARRWPLGSTGGTRTFKELAASTGACKLGIVRGDADNLGALFARGLGDRATISRVATLSAALSEFFEGYLGHLAETRYPETVGLVYAGGDDFFAVGGWNDVLDFTRQARERFAEFCGGNPALSFSAGAVVVDDHLPLPHGAELARQAEEASKAYERPTGRKNALTLFDTPIGFEEMPRFVGFRDLLLDGLTQEERPLPTSFLRRLFEVWEIYVHERKLIERRSRGATMDAVRNEARWQRWRWQLIYGLRTYAGKYPGHQERIEAIQQQLLDERYPLEDRLGAVLRWTELLLRRKED